VSHLFRPLTLRSLTLPNRIGVSPMCQYSAVDGVPQDWHLVHLGGLATGGAGLVFTEATAVEARGRISPQDTGIYTAEQAEAWRPIAAFIREHGAVPAMQLAHAGFKASTYSPFADHDGAVPPADGGWTPVAPTDRAFIESYPVPERLTEEQIEQIIRHFADAATRAVDAGFGVVEVHAAHGYLLHEFLSPLSNDRTDSYGGSLENRMRLPIAVVEAVRAAVGPDVPVFVRISASDWVDGGWSIADSVVLARQLRAAGADLIDCSSGGVAAKADIPAGPGYQVSFARQVRAEADISTAAVGMITAVEQAEQILAEESADLVLLGRELLRDPRWPYKAALALGELPNPPAQYRRAF
jgi:2,4-dienoyl-CoA reductase-like NADH-dependent reductase (Old Yellow Enzyme family)